VTTHRASGDWNGSGRQLIRRASQPRAMNRAIVEAVKGNGRMAGQLVAVITGPSVTGISGVKRMYAPDMDAIKARVTAFDAECVVEGAPEGADARWEPIRGDGDDTSQRPKFIYVLTLMGDAHYPAYYYVGTTTDPDARMQNHLEGGTGWTKWHPPSSPSFTELTPVSADENAFLLEDSKTKELMILHGIDAVRGGCYSRQTLSKSMVVELKRALLHATDRCLACGGTGHFIGSCQAQRAKAPCMRCGRWSHTAANCTNAASTRSDAE
jgi:predicted GIY-YIG superfamily endonuclease